MAFITTAAGPIFHRFLKMDSIAKPEGCVRSVLRALLIGPVTRQVLTCGYLVPQSTTVSLRRKTAYLIHLSKIFCPSREKRVSRQPVQTPPGNWKSQPGNSRRAPFDARAGKGASRARRGHRKSPLARQIGNYVRGESENPGRLIPIPVLPVDCFHRAHERRFARLPTTVQVKKRFAPGNHAVVVAGCAADGQSAPFGLAPGNAPHKFPGIDPAALVETPGKASRPARSPLRIQGRPLVVICVGKIEKIIFLTETKLVFRFCAEGIQP